MEKEEIFYYLTSSSKEELFRKADEIRKKFCKDKVLVRGIIEFSNYCCRSCLYCGLRKENRKVRRYRLSKSEILKCTDTVIQLGIKTVVLQSGDDFFYRRETLVSIIKEIKKKYPEVAITLCIGERPWDDYKAFKEAGADRFLLKHETANPSLYERLHPGQSLNHRLRILEYLKKLGYQIGAGNIVGLPYQTVRDLVEDILLLKKLDVDMAGIGPFIPQKDTPLKNYPPGSLTLTLKVLSLVRIVVQDIHLPATTALATLDPLCGQLLGLKAGANVIMSDFTPEEYRRSYTIYNNKIRIDLPRVREVVSKAGRVLSLEKGDSLKKMGTFK